MENLHHSTPWSCAAFHVRFCASVLRKASYSALMGLWGDVCQARARCFATEYGMRDQRWWEGLGNESVGGFDLKCRLVAT